MTFVCLPLAGHPAWAAENVIKWRMASNNVRGNTLSQIYPSMFEHIKKASGGQLEIEIVYDGEGVAQSGVYDAVVNGLVQMGDPYIGMGAKIPFAEVEIGLPASPVIADMPPLLQRGGWNEVLNKAYADLGVVRLGAVHQPGSYLISKKPINSLADFKGLKVRAFEPYASLIANLEGVPVFIPFAEVYTSLATGVVDAAITTIIDHEDGKFYEVAKFLYPLPVSGNMSMPIIVNKQAWDSLPPNLQGILQLAVTVYEFNFANACRIWEREALVKMMQNGLSWCAKPSAEDEANWNAAGEKVWQNFKDPYSMELITLLKKYTVLMNQ